MNPKVSILIPCYNSQQWVAQSIESALSQTYPNKEVIVVDDGSTDGSLEIIKSFGDAIRWEAQPNQGGNVARNRLLELSSGEWLQYLDADDYLMAEKIEQQVNYLKQHQKVDVIYGPSIFEVWEGKLVKRKIIPIPEPYDSWTLLAMWLLPQTGSPLWRKDVLLDVGGWKADQPVCQEHELYLRLLKANKSFEYCNYSGSIYRHWSESTVCKKDKSLTYQHRLEIIDKLELHLKLIGQLNSERLNAINQSRFDCARIIWLFNRNWAKSIIQRIYESYPSFKLPISTAPMLYQGIYSIIGFEAAEMTAKLKRKLFGKYNNKYK